MSLLVLYQDTNNNIVGVLFAISDFAYWLFVTDLGVIRDFWNMGIGFLNKKSIRAFRRRR